MKNRYIQIRLSEEEFQKLEKMAKEKGLKKSDILRSSLYKKDEGEK